MTKQLRQMPENLSNKRFQNILLSFLLPLTIFTSTCYSQSSVASSFGIGAKVPVSQNLEVRVGMASLIKLPQKPERMAVSNPGIVYVKMITPDEVQIIGRNPGRTNLYVWFPPAENAKAGTPSKIIGTEISVGLPAPPYLPNNTLEVINGDAGTELLYMGNPSERIRNSRPARTSGPSTDMPEPCLSPGCI
jgi:hypothetical protein